MNKIIAYIYIYIQNQGKRRFQFTRNLLWERGERYLISTRFGDVYV